MKTRLAFNFIKGSSSFDCSNYNSIASKSLINFLMRCSSAHDRGSFSMAEFGAGKREISANLDVVFNLLPTRCALLFLNTLFVPGGWTVVVPKFSGEVPTEAAD